MLKERDIYIDICDIHEGVTKLTAISEMASFGKTILPADSGKAAAAKRHKF